MTTPATIPYSHELPWPEGMAPFETVDFAIQKDPYAHYAWMREHAPVLRTKTAARDVWFISRYDDVRAALRAPKVFSSAVVRPQPLVFLTLFDPPEQTRLRMVVANAFTPKAVQVLSEQIHGYAEGYLDALLETGGGDVVDRFALRITMATISAVLGIPREDFHRMKDWSDYVSSYFGRLARQAPGLDNDEEGANEFFDYLLDHLKHRAELTEHETVGSNVARLMKSGDLTETEAKHFCAFLFTAGHETTTVLLANAFRLFAENSALLERIRNNPDDAPNFVEEIVRYRGTVHRLTRRTNEDVEVAGVTIPKDSVVILLPASANRDETKFESPDVFDIDRDLSGHLGFGHGIHACLGQHLARLEGGIAVNLIAQRIADVALNPDDPMQFVTGGNLANSGPSYLNAKLTGCPVHKDA